MEKDLKERKKSGTKKGKRTLLKGRGKIRGTKNSKKKKFGEGFKEEEKSRGEKEKILGETRGGKNLEKNLRSGTKKFKIGN